MEGRGLGLGGDTRRIGKLRNARAGAVAAVAPPVIGADDLVTLHRPERKGGAAMDAEVEECVGGAIRVTPEHERLAQQVDGRRGARLEVARVGDRMPAGAEGLRMAGYRRRRHGGSLVRRGTDTRPRIVRARHAREPASAGRARDDCFPGAPPGGAGDRSADREQEERREHDDGVAQRCDDTGVHQVSSLGRIPALLVDVSIAGRARDSGGAPRPRGGGAADAARRDVGDVPVRRRPSPARAVPARRRGGAATWRARRRLLALRGARQRLRLGVGALAASSRSPSRPASRSSSCSSRGSTSASPATCPTSSPPSSG